MNNQNQITESYNLYLNTIDNSYVIINNNLNYIVQVNNFLILIENSVDVIALQLKKIELECNEIILLK